MTNNLYAAIDLGGTKIYSVLANSKGDILAHTRLETRAREGSETVMDQMVSSVDQLLEKSGGKKVQLAKIGVCIAGFYDWEKRLLIHSPNMAGWSDVDVESRLQDKLGIPVIAENDANAAALGESRRGAGQGSGDMVFITVSTGIGAGLITDGKIYRGSRGFAGEAGHMVVKPDGPLCGCGRRGCLETVASGTAIARIANEHMQNGRKTILSEITAQNSKVTAPDVFAAAKKKDPLAQEVLQEAIHYLGIGLVNLVNLLNPQVIVIGGGVSEAGDDLFVPLRQIIAEHAVPPAAASVTLRKAALGMEAGVAGMLCLLTESKALGEG
ncbi:ROK family protein [Dethiobacter alkaliphilus]|uniref:ROK family protein n=1 Tax=Dethiobacter alkaliphilus TaxID=427926 RepID=UPI0022269215|nr:ROK family protein [Dethiobacter alkaliphilus]MCW3491562.1 ROK family protein [Dethiobacter alkaliphilus]